MPIKYNNFDIGNAYLGNDNLSAIYLGSNLVWTNGIKLKSLLGKVITNGGDSNWSLNINGTGELIANIDFPAPAFISTQKNLTVNENHYYYYFSGNTDENIQLSYYTNAGFYAKGYGAVVKGSNIQTLQPIWRFMTGLKKGNYHLTPFILDLTQAKLDTLTAQQLYDLITLNGTDFTDLELLASGYEIKLGSFNNLGKYNFVKLKDLNFEKATNNNGVSFFRTYGLNQSIIIGTLNTLKIFCPTYNAINTINVSVATDTTFPNKSCCQSSGGYSFCVRNDDYLNATDFKNSLTDDDILIYEVKDPFGNKLDNYTAEQVYYMFFATLGNSKMYVPQGVRFESSDNIILGTKYGVVDMSKIYYSYQSGNNRFYSSGIQNIVKYTQGDTASVPNIYVDGLEVISLNTMGSGTTHDYSITIYNGLIFVRVLQYTQPNDLINFFKGKYLIFPLATPNGTDYNDLTAKEMYDMLNTNKIDVIADGKSIGGVRSLLGKQNELQNVNTGLTADIYFGNNCWGVGGLTNNNQLLNIGLIANHKYLFVVNWQKQQDRTGMSWNVFEFMYSGGTMIGNAYAYNHLNYDTNKVFAGTFTPNENGTLAKFRYYINNGLPIDSNLDIPQSYIIIDLTEHNLQNLTAQEAYQYFKEYDLQTLEKSSVLLIGGYIKS